MMMMVVLLIILHPEDFPRIYHISEQVSIFHCAGTRQSTASKVDDDDEDEDADDDGVDLVDNSSPGNCRYEAEHSILTAAKLISPVIEETFSLGYNWSVTMRSLLARHWVKEKIDLSIDSFLGETWGTDLYT